VSPEGRLKCESDKTVCIWGSKCNRVQDVLYLFCKHISTKGHTLMYTK